MTTALVTAAGGVIGRAVVERLLAEKVVNRVIGVDIADPDPADPLPEGAESLRCDLLDPAALTALTDAVPDELDVLVHVLGGERRPPVAPVPEVSWPPPEVWDDILDLNVSAPYRITRLLADRLVPGAAVCNVSSIAATMPWAVSPAYGAAKAALEHWSNSLAVLLADSGVRVNLVRPGFVWSSQWQAVDHAEFARVVRDRVPLRQQNARNDGTIPTDGTPSTDREQSARAVADAVAYLCSPAAAHVTGQAINVDGGAALVRAAR